MRSLADRREQVARGVALGVANDSDADTEFVGDGPFGNGFGGVVGPLGVNVGKEFLKQLFHVGLRENQDEVDSANGGDQLRSGLLIKNGAAGAFQVTKTGIGIYGDDEDVALAPSALEIAGVADVESVKAAVGENDALASLLSFAEKGAKFVARDDLGLGSAHGSGSRLRSRIVNSFEQPGARNGGGAALHDDETTGNVCDVGSLEWSCTAGEREGVGGKDGVSRAGDVDGLIAAVNGDVGGPRRLLEESHAMFAARDEEGEEFHVAERAGGAALEFSEIFADDGVMQCFHFRFVGSGSGDSGALVVAEAIAGIQSDGDVFFDAGNGGAEIREIHDAEAVVGNGECVGTSDFREEGGAQFFAIGFGERMGGFVIDAENLLSDGVGPASEETRFRGSGPTFGANDAGSVDVAFTESVDETSAGGINADGSDGDDLGAKGGEIVGGIGATARNDLGLAMAEDQDGSFA